MSAFRVCMLLFGTWQTNGRRERGKSVVHRTGRVLLSLQRPHADSLEQTIQHLYLCTLCVFAEPDLIILNCALHCLVVKYSQYDYKYAQTSEDRPAMPTPFLTTCLSVPQSCYSHCQCSCVLEIAVLKDRLACIRKQVKTVVRPWSVTLQTYARRRETPTRAFRATVCRSCNISAVAVQMQQYSWSV